MPLKGDIEFIPVSGPITGHITKFGGQPTWLESPQWPLSRETGNPMRFIGQIALDAQLFPDAAGCMAYLFITDEEDDYIDGTWEPDGGENAVIIQPGGAAPNVECFAQATGPSLITMVEGGGIRLQTVEQEYAAKLSLRDEPAYHSDDARAGWTDDQFQQYAAALEGNKLGGSPLFLQNEEFPDGGVWNLLLQLDSGKVPFSINFGDVGVGYAFIDPKGRVGKMLWQCG